MPSYFPKALISKSSSDENESESVLGVYIDRFFLYIHDRYIAKLFTPSTTEITPKNSASLATARKYRVSSIYNNARINPLLSCCGSVWTNCSKTNLHETLKTLRSISFGMPQLKEIIVNDIILTIFDIMYRLIRIHYFPFVHRE